MWASLLNTWRTLMNYKRMIFSFRWQSAMKYDVFSSLYQLESMLFDQTLQGRLNRLHPRSGTRFPILDYAPCSHIGRVNFVNLAHCKVSTIGTFVLEYALFLDGQRCPQTWESTQFPSFWSVLKPPPFWKRLLSGIETNQAAWASNLWIQSHSTNVVCPNIRFPYYRLP